MRATLAAWLTMLASCGVFFLSGGPMVVIVVVILGWSVEFWACWSLIGDPEGEAFEWSLWAEWALLRGETRPFCEGIVRIMMKNYYEKIGGVMVEGFWAGTEGVKRRTCLAHRKPQLLQRSLCPLGPLLHSGVCLV
jgi:hypothetical protein